MITQDGRPTGCDSCDQTTRYSGFALHRDELAAQKRKVEAMERAKQKDTEAAVFMAIGRAVHAEMQTDKGFGKEVLAVVGVSIKGKLVRDALGLPPLPEEKRADADDKPKLRLAKDSEAA